MDQVGGRFVIADMYRHAAGEALGGAQQLRLDRVVALAEDDDLAALEDDLVGGIGKHVETLLPCETADGGKDRAVIHVEAEALQKHRLVLAFALQRRDIIIAWQMRVGGRIPDVEIDAVDDAAQNRDALVQYAVHAHAEARGQDLAGIGGADGGDGIGGLQTAFEEADIAEIFHAVHGIERGRQADHRQDIGAVLALESDIVDGDDARHADAHLAQIDRGEGRLPVMGMDDIGAPAGISPPAISAAALDSAAKRRQLSGWSVPSGST